MTLSMRIAAFAHSGGKAARRSHWSAGMALAAALIPAAAQAHPGDHGALGFVAMAHHLLTEPDHLMMLSALGLVAASMLIGRRRARR